MEITHFCNSFISANFLKVKFMYPWVGTTKDNGWISHPTDYGSIKITQTRLYLYKSLALRPLRKTLIKLRIIIK